MHRHLLMLLVAVVAATACKKNGESSDDYKDFTRLDISVCAPSAGPFSLTIDNDFFPLSVGSQLVLEGDDDGTLVSVQITVLDETENVAGVDTRVVEESESEDGEIVEISRNFFAAAPDGTVCYFGEDVDIYSGGTIVAHSGAWRAGEGENLPGIIMPGDPQVGTAFEQEHAPGVAEDMSAITSFGDEVSTPAGDFTDTLRAFDWDALGSGSGGDVKFYARGLGLIMDDVVRLKSHTP